MSIQQAYTDWSATYDQDQNLTRDLDEIVTRETLGHLRSNSSLEIGCGTGKNTPLLAQISQHVSAADHVFVFGSIGSVLFQYDRNPFGLMKSGGALALRQPRSI